ncbi:50S ribosomal protein L16 [Candidatus Peribacteria bacterium]|jgi:large subunit ribosomal protein L16|nr:50S ribosomal protein L16 [Candidatus Peribacteria bacterium]MBT4021382.1 50S ribosomal protein L16 [Candidatus Peribacteria bacterium]MBT4240554.1 50S ribosomal protein L16 [Candidatus Peribacteria bacterium]MBT4474394.1 50S ribosomal protein L16 [Candidatus Peribacteria bacterium]
MLQPAKTKHRKSHRLRGSFSGKATRGAQLAFGAVGLKSQGTAEITSRQIEAARKVMTHTLKRGGKIWIRIFPHKPVTKKGAEVPMGSGKGAIEYYVATVKPGHVLFEIGGVDETLAREALRLAAYKLPIKTKVISRIRHE